MQSFNRLLKEVDSLTERGKIGGKVIAQTGNSTYTPKKFKWFKFVDSKKFEELCKNSSIIITHAGVGSIMTALKFNKSTIVVPRLKRFGEHNDDHQLQIAKELGKQKKVLAVYNIDNLGEAVIKARNWVPSKLKKESKIIELINKKLLEWQNGGVL